jgi:ABC-type branched-subunit amino acid transport system ATPase component
MLSLPTYSIIPINSNALSPKSFKIAFRGYVLLTGRIVGEGSGKAFLESDMFREAFLGI